MRRIIRTFILLYGLLVSAFCAANAVVPAEIYQGAAAKASTPALKSSSSGLRYQGKSSRPRIVSLGEPATDELKKLQTNSGRRKAFQIGIQRVVPQLPAVAEWGLFPVNGGQVAQFVIVSEQASRLRALIKLDSDLPDGVEIRIYNPTVSDKVFGPFTQLNFEDSEKGLWTPTLAGEEVGIEVFLPQSVSPNLVQISIPEVSHIIYDLKSNAFKNLSTSKFSACDISIACADSEWQETGKAVARYIYTAGDGNSYLCSGTLLADQVDTSQIPYFLTAAHCVADANAASSMDFFWFYRESSCGADDAQWEQVSGGAQMLVARSELDTALVQLNNAPPTGTIMSGWVLDELQVGTDVSGIHHGLGNPKQYSQGAFNTFARINIVNGGYEVIPDNQGDFAQVQWNQGITAPGSSGSGLWINVQGQHLLKGTLLGGSSGCDNPTAPDEYTRLERFYPFATTWLGASPLVGIFDVNDEFQALTDGVLLTRYINGVRGSSLLEGVTAENIDLGPVESSLAEITADLDIDEDGNVDAETDALLFVRYLLGLRGNSLVSGLDLSGSSNNTVSGISHRIQTLLDGG